VRFIALLPQHPHPPDTRMVEHLHPMRGLGQLLRQVLAGEVLVFVDAAPPLGAVGHIYTENGYKLRNREMKDGESGKIDG